MVNINISQAIDLFILIKRPELPANQTVPTVHPVFLWDDAKTGFANRSLMFNL